MHEPKTNLKVFFLRNVYNERQDSRPNLMAAMVVTNIHLPEIPTSSAEFDPSLPLNTDQVGNHLFRVASETRKD